MPHEHVADVDTPDRYFLEPLLVRIVVAQQVVRPRVVALNAVTVDHPEIDEAAERLLEIVQHDGQVLVAAPLFDALLLDEQFQGRNPLLHDELEGTGDVGQRTHDAVTVFRLERAAVHEVVQLRHHQQRGQRNEQGQHHDVQPDLAIPGELLPLADLHAPPRGQQHSQQESQRGNLAARRQEPLDLGLRAGRCGQPHSSGVCFSGRCGLPILR